MTNLRSQCQGRKGKDRSGGLRIVGILSRDRAILRQPVGQRSIDLGEELLAHFFTGGLIKPVKEPTASSRLTQPLICFKTNIGEELFDFANRGQAVSLPATVAQTACGLDRPILHAL